MLARMAVRSLTRRPGRRALASVAVALGTSVVGALVTVASDVGDRLSRDLRASGANIVLLPEGQAEPAALPGGTLTVPLPGPLLRERDVASILTTFWANNVVALSPSLELQGRLRTPAVDGDVLVVGTYFRAELASTVPSGARPMGLLEVAPYAVVNGRAPVMDDGGAGRGPDTEALVGVSLAARRGLAPANRAQLSITRPDGSSATLAMTVVGTVSTGGEEDDRLFLPLAAVQQASAQAGLVSRVLVSAQLAPEDRLYERASRGLESLSPQDYEIYACRAYPWPVARDLAAAVAGSEGRPLVKTADAEGRIVEGMRWVTTFVAGAVVLSALLAILAALATSIVERRQEVGLVKALGASPFQVVAPFLVETAATGLIGGLAGFALGALLARVIGIMVFSRPAAPSALFFTPALTVALALALIGSLIPLRLVLRLDAVAVLKGD